MCIILLYMYKCIDYETHANVIIETLIRKASDTVCPKFQNCVYIVHTKNLSCLHGCIVVWSNFNPQGSCVLATIIKFACVCKISPIISGCVYIHWPTIMTQLVQYVYSGCIGRLFSIATCICHMYR